MSKSSIWGAAVSVCFGIFAQIAPIPETWRWPITWVAGAALLISCVGWCFSYFTKQLKVTLVPWWGAPQKATIVNRNPDYPAHVKRSTLYGVRWFRRQHLYEASNFQQCPRAPFTIEPGRQIEQAYGGYIPFNQFKFLQAKIELENGKVFVSKKARSPTPPSDKHKRTESVTPEESESIQDEEKSTNTDSSSKTTVELLDDLISEGKIIERFCGDMCDGEIAKRKVDAWVAKVRSTLRNNLADYVAAFNDAVLQGGTARLYPPDRGSRTVIEMGRWAEDRVRQSAWQLAFACLVRLTEIRKAVRAKLPL